jgi:hypothetical protein
MKTKKLVIITIILLSLISLYKQINLTQVQKKSKEIIVEGNNAIVLKENKIKLTQPEPLNFKPAQNYLESGGNSKNK